ncbi:hypothetical protein MD484_g6789, partial [Candolleomyces efflorescens]
MAEPITMSNFHGAHDFNIEGDINIYAKSHHEVRSRLSAVKELRDHIAAGAMHDSEERCDAPKCHRETRLAVQDELVQWIEQGDEEPQPKKIIWVTGPAGGGKTAIMGSTADTCQEKGLLACGFFFSSFAASANRRLKKCLVPTLAYQLAQHDALGSAIGGLRSSAFAAIARGTRGWKFTVLIDGLDECQAQEHGAMPRSLEEAARANEVDQMEILHALYEATNDPTFPFRFIIASRPEPAIKSFFTGIAHHTTKKIFLDDKYDPDADMLLFLQSKFETIRLRYQLTAPWPTEDVKRTLVGNASGQFIYVATVMRFLEGSSGPPHELLDQVMKLRTGSQDVSAKPFAALDALYTHVLNSSPKPLLAARWLSLIFRTNLLEHRTITPHHAGYFTSP